MKYNLYLFLLVFLPLHLMAQVEEEIILSTKTGNIKGSLLLPADSVKIPVVLIIAGSGPTDRNGNNTMMTNNSLKLLAEELQKNGVASVRYDKRGIGESKSAGMLEQDLRFEHYIKDVEDWVELLKDNQSFSKVIVLGHSEGSLIGMIASQQGNVNKFISVAGAGRPAGDLIKEQLKTQPQYVIDQSLSIIDKLENGETVEKVPPMLFSLFRPSVQAYLISWFKYNPLEEIAKLDIPVLVIQGSTDIQVSVSDAHNLENANENAQKHIIKGMNHILKESVADIQKNIETYSNPELPLKPELSEVILKFIKD